MNNTIIFILGMGRSGTSALTRVLALCGAALPSNLLGATEGNPRGHWEPLQALKINEDFLSKHGSSWYDPTLRLQREIALPQVTLDFVGQIREFLTASVTERPLVIKEPRITALAEYWFKAANELGLQVKVVIPVRHPNEVTASLRARDGISVELASMLYVKYNLLAERWSRNFSRMFVSYCNLLDNWRREIERISIGLSLEFREPDEGSVAEFLSPDLHRQIDSGPPPDWIFGMNWMDTINTTFSAAADGASWDMTKLDGIFEVFSALETTFRHSLDEFREAWQPK
jgi:hypothetical protein